MENKIKIIIVDNMALFRNHVRKMLIDKPVEIIGEAQNGKVGLELIEILRPDVVLLDLEMPEMNGREMYEIMRVKYPSIPVLIISVHYSEDFVSDYLKSGVKGYLPKDATSAENLFNAVSAIHRGEIYEYEYTEEEIVILSEEVKFSITGRQRTVLYYILRSHTNKEIAVIMKVKVRAVERIRRRIAKKFGVKKKVDFMKVAITNGFHLLGLEEDAKDIKFLKNSHKISHSKKRKPPASDNAGDS